MTESSEARKTRKAAEVALAESTPVKIENHSEEWSEYELSDGNKLRIKPVVMEVRKSKKKGLDGNPQYQIRSTMLIDVQKK